MSNNDEITCTGTITWQKKLNKIYLYKIKSSFCFQHKVKPYTLFGNKLPPLNVHFLFFSLVFHQIHESELSKSPGAYLCYRNEIKKNLVNCIKR